MTVQLSSQVYQAVLTSPNKLRRDAEGVRASRDAPLCRTYMPDDPQPLTRMLAHGSAQLQLEGVRLWGSKTVARQEGWLAPSAAARVLLVGVVDRP